MKVVNLLAIEGGPNIKRATDKQLYALCDDGTIWTAVAVAAQDHEWHRVNPPPGCEVQDG